METQMKYLFGYRLQGHGTNFTHQTTREKRWRAGRTSGMIVETIEAKNEDLALKAISERLRELRTKNGKIVREPWALCVSHSLDISKL